MVHLIMQCIEQTSPAHPYPDKLCLMTCPRTRITLLCTSKEQMYKFVLKYLEGKGKMCNIWNCILKSDHINELTYVSRGT